MKPASPTRRLLFKAGLAIGVLGAAGAGSLWWRRGVVNGHLSDSGKALFRAVARGVLSDILPAEASAREAALDDHLSRLDGYVALLPAAVRQELALLVGALSNLPSRLLLTGMYTDWSRASDTQVQHALETLRLAGSATNRSIYHGLRDVVCLTYFSAPSTWAVTGYPGPADV